MFHFNSKSATYDLQQTTNSNFVAFFKKSPDIALADDSHAISYLFLQNLGKMSQNLSSAAFVIGALRVNHNISRLLKGEIGVRGVDSLHTSVVCR